MADQNKTEKATPRRRLKAREHGQVARSRDLVAGLGTMAAVMLLAWQLPGFVSDWRSLLRHQMDWAALRTEQGLPVWRNDFFIFRGVALAASLSWLIATLGGVAQGGLVFAPAALTPNLNGLNPGSRLGQLFSLSAVSHLLKALLPTAVIIYLAVSLLARDWLRLPGLLHRNPAGTLSYTTSRMFELAWKASLVLLVWSAADYFLERWKHENELKMSRQDLRDEFKDTEGNPQVKMRVRRLQRQARRRRMLKDVERAAVVITNPTEYAIALEFRMEMEAPVVVAKGRNLLAAQIREIALWQGIPLVENPPLAHALYRAVEVGQAIPPKLYAVVAEILAAIWRAQARAAKPAAEATRTVTACAAISSSPKKFSRPTPVRQAQYPTTQRRPAAGRGDQAHQQVARRCGERRHHRIGPGVLPVQAHHRHHGEDQPGGQPGGRRHQAPAQRRHQHRRHRHRHRGREPRHQRAAARHPYHRPHEDVVGAMDRIHMAQHPYELAKGALYRRQRGGLIPPVRRAGDPPQHHRQCHHRRHHQHPDRAAGPRQGGRVTGRAATLGSRASTAR